MMKLIDKCFWPVVFIGCFVATILIAKYQIATMGDINGQALIPVGILLAMAVINEFKNAIVETWGSFFNE